MFRHSQVIKVKKQRIKNPVTDPDFGKAFFSIPTNQLHKKILQKEGAYFWFPIVGDSMTDNTGKSIPEGSLVLVRELTFNFDAFLYEHIPLHKALIITGYDREGKLFNILKTIGYIDTCYWRLLLRSYNPTMKDFWLHMDKVKRIFEVELVKRPDGTEFIPTVWKESCNKALPNMDKVFINNFITIKKA